MISITQALRQAQAQGLERLDAQLLLLHALGRTVKERAWLLSHDADPLPPTALVCYDSAVLRRACGEPLAYITGHKEFFGLDLKVDPRVLVPRPETETLVAWALELLSDASRPDLCALDLGTGSGAIALALKAMRPDLHVSAIDASEDALTVARENAHCLGLKVDFRQGCWLEGVRSKYQLMVANPPYISAADPHLAALSHEPRQSLISGTDGLDDLRQIIAQAPACLNVGGWLLLEHGYDQATAVRNLLTHAGFHAVHSRLDLGGIERCSGGRIAG